MVFVGEGMSKKFMTVLVDYYYGQCYRPDTKELLPFSPNRVFPRKGKCFLQVYDQKIVIRWVFVDEELAEG